MKCHCGERIPDARVGLGYRTCLPCGEAQARSVRWCTAPLNKSNYVVISNKAELAMLNPKRVGGA